LRKPIRAWISLIGLAACMLGYAGAQQAAPQGPGDGGPPPMEGGRPPMERAFHLGPRGRWWNNPDVASKLGLNADQQKKMEAVFEQARPGLMSQSDALRNEEKTMAPLLAADQPDEGRILAQIDRIAQARAELEKANARMLLGLRRILTPDQWKTLQEMDPHRGYPRFGNRPGDAPPPPSAGNP
jgi:periplasmic protein CpxP/Spy